MHIYKIKNNVIYYKFFPKCVFEKKHVFLPKIASFGSISQKISGGIAFSDPQQFSELENFSPLGAGKVSCPID